MKYHRLQAAHTVGYSLSSLKAYLNGNVVQT